MPAKLRSRIDNRQSSVYLYPAVNEPDRTLDKKLNAIADPTRRRILQVLKERGACSLDKEVGLCASDIETRIHLSQPTISHHMAVLRKAGFVEAVKLGQWVWYRRDETALRDFWRKLRHL